MNDLIKLGRCSDETKTTYKSQLSSDDSNADQGRSGNFLTSVCTDEVEFAENSTSEFC